MKWNAEQQKDRLAITIYFSSKREQELYDVIKAEATAKRMSLAAFVYNILEDKYDCRLHAWPNQGDNL